MGFYLESVHKKSLLLLINSHYVTKIVSFLRGLLYWALVFT